MRAAVLMLGFLPGCILVRTSEHRIRFTGAGSGEAFLRLIDIRSDGKTEAAIEEDYDLLMKLYREDGLPAFEREGRKVTGKQLIVRGDTLIAEIRYTFSSFTALEGMRLVSDELFVVVTPEREIVRTNGSIESFEGNTKRIMWDLSTERLQYQITEKSLPSSISLTERYRKSEK